MNSFIKKINRFSISLTTLVIVFITAMVSMALTAFAMDGYSDEIGIRGFVLPKEALQPANVKGTVIKDAMQIDFFKIAFIGLIVLGVLLLAALALFFIKNAKRGISNEL